MARPLNKTQEVVEEFRTVVLGRAHLLDTILPPLAFLIVQRFAAIPLALLAAFVLSGGFAALRLLRRQTALYSLLGLAASALAFFTARILQRAEAFFLPDLVTNLALAALALISLAAGRPLVAWTSQLIRRWPWAWYTHPRVRPAYSEVTLAWSV